MKREDLLLNKIKLLLARIKAPRYLNKYGPKKYTLADKLYSLFLRAEWKASFRRASKLSNQIGISCPSKSTLHYMLHRLPWKFIKGMLMITAGKQAYIAALDGTGLSRKRLSEHYSLRAGIKLKERKSTKLSIIVDTRSKKILAARFRKKMAHDIKDVKYLLKNLGAKPAKIAADKAYDAEWFRAFLAEQGIGYSIPIKGKAIHGYYRKRYVHDNRTYHRRVIVESCFFRLKQLFGHYVSCVSARNMRAEVFLRIILYNLSLLFHMI